MATKVPGMLGWPPHFPLSFRDLTLPGGQNTAKPVNLLPERYSALPKFGIAAYIETARPTKRGGSRVVRSAGRVAVDAAASCTRGQGQGGLLSVNPRLRADERRCVRTAKPCGPGRRCYGQALADAALASTGAVSATFARRGRPEGIRLPGEHGISRQPTAQGRPCVRLHLYAAVQFFLRYMRTADRGCEVSTRPSLRPLS
ncbi:hypothetical protein ABID59_002468 [Bradyrhizobium sp. S3.3.6]